MPAYSVRFGLLKALRIGVTDAKIERHDPCIIETEEGAQWGEVLLQIPESETLETLNHSASDHLPIRKIVPEDLQVRAENLAGQEHDTQLLEELIGARSGLTLLGVERFFGTNHRLIYFRCTETFNWRDLSETFLEKRGGTCRWLQLNARQSAKLCGGIGVCGRELCCSTFLRDLEPVTLAQARGQSRSLSPRESAGACGRLKCCLRYEETPQAKIAKGDWVVGPRFEGRVVAIGPFHRKLTIETVSGHQRKMYMREVLSHEAH